MKGTVSNWQNFSGAQRQLNKTVPVTKVAGRILKPNKCRFVQLEFYYLGSAVSAEGVHTSSGIFSTYSTNIKQLR